MKRVKVWCKVKGDQSGYQWELQNVAGVMSIEDLKFQVCKVFCPLAYVQNLDLSLILLETSSGLKQPSLLEATSVQALRALLRCADNSPLRLVVNILPSARPHHLLRTAFEIACMPLPRLLSPPPFPSPSLPHLNYPSSSSLFPRVLLKPWRDWHSRMHRLLCELDDNHASISLISPPFYVDSESGDAFSPDPKSFCDALYSLVIGYTNKLARRSDIRLNFCFRGPNDCSSSAHLLMLDPDTPRDPLEPSNRVFAVGFVTPRFLRNFHPYEPNPIEAYIDHTSIEPLGGHLKPPHASKAQVNAPHGNNQDTTIDPLSDFGLHIGQDRHIDPMPSSTQVDTHDSPNLLQVDTRDAPSLSQVCQSNSVSMGVFVPNPNLSSNATLDNASMHQFNPNCGLIEILTSSSSPPGEKEAIQRAIDNLYASMMVDCAWFGFLTDYHVTFFFKRSTRANDSRLLSVSPPVYAHLGTPLVAFLFLMQRADFFAQHHIT